MQKSILGKLKDILKKSFKNNINKQEILVKHNRINFACPYCGDSANNFYKKRGNIITDGQFEGFYKCYNCGIFRRTDIFFKDFETELSYEEVSNIIDNIKIDKHNYNNKIDISNILDLDNIIKYTIPRNHLKRLFNFYEINDKESYYAKKYLLERNQTNFNNFLYNKKNNSIVILNNTYDDSRVFGFQEKMLNKNKVRFITHKLSEIHNNLGINVIDNNNKLYIDTISLIFNIHKIDFNKSVYLLEGPMDSFLMNNSISIAGANKELPIDLEVKYFYDYDKTGIEKSIKHLELGNYVFLWSKLLNDYKIPYRKKWDLNDLLNYTIQKNIKINNIEKYFSNDILDIIDI